MSSIVELGENSFQVLKWLMIAKIPTSLCEALQFIGGIMFSCRYATSNFQPDLSHPRHSVIANQNLSSDSNLLRYVRVVPGLEYFLSGHGPKLLPGVNQGIFFWGEGERGYLNIEGNCTKN